MQSSVYRPPKIVFRSPGLPQREPNLKELDFEIHVGIEVEFLLSRLDGSHTDSIIEFADDVAERYSIYKFGRVSPGPREIYNLIKPSSATVPIPTRKWTLETDSTIQQYEDDTRSNVNKPPFPLELSSSLMAPKFSRSERLTSWRDEIREVWQYLKSEYQISANDSCGTHVLVQITPDYHLYDAINIASAVIHFEPAFDALLPPARLRNKYAKSNWIDNPRLGGAGLSRGQSIAAINRCTSIRELVSLIQPDENGQPDKMYGWNFLPLFEVYDTRIEFRRGAASTELSDIFMWTELALAFITASTVAGDWDHLRHIPSCVGGLHWFLYNSGLPMGDSKPFDLRVLEPLFDGVDLYAAPPPQPLPPLTKAEAKMLRTKRKEDQDRANSRIERGRPEWVDITLWGLFVIGTLPFWPCTMLWIWITDPEHFQRPREK